MKQKKQRTVAAARLSPELSEKLDRYLEKQRRLTGFKITRSAAVSRFVERGLAAEDKK